MRMDIPRFAPVATQENYLEGLKCAITTAMSNPALIERFTTHLQDEAHPRPSFHLPDIHFGSTSYIILLAPSGLRPVPVIDDDAVDILIEGTKVRFHEAAKSLLSYLNEHSRIPVAEFMEAFAEAFSIEQLEDFLRAMATNGLISIRADEPCGILGPLRAETGVEC